MTTFLEASKRFDFNGTKKTGLPTTNLKNSNANFIQNEKRAPKDGNICRSFPFQSKSKKKINMLNSTNNSLKKTDSSGQDEGIFSTSYEIETRKKNVEINLKKFQAKCRVAALTKKYEHLLKEDLIPLLESIKHAINGPGSTSALQMYRKVVSNLLSYMCYAIKFNTEIVKEEKWIEILSMIFQMKLKLLITDGELRKENKETSKEPFSEYKKKYMSNYLNIFKTELDTLCNNNRTIILTVLLRIVIHPSMYLIQCQMLQKLISVSLNEPNHLEGLSSIKYLINVLSYKKMSELETDVGKKEELQKTVTTKYPDKIVPAMIIRYIKEKSFTIRNFSKYLFDSTLEVYNILDEFKKFEASKKYSTTYCSVLENTMFSNQRISLNHNENKIGKNEKLQSDNILNKIPTEINLISSVHFPSCSPNSIVDTESDDCYYSDTDLNNVDSFDYSPPYNIETEMDSMDYYRKDTVTNSKNIRLDEPPLQKSPIIPTLNTKDTSNAAILQKRTSCTLNDDLDVVETNRPPVTCIDLTHLDSDVEDENVSNNSLDHLLKKEKIDDNLTATQLSPSPALTSSTIVTSTPKTKTTVSNDQVNFAELENANDSAIESENLELNETPSTTVSSNETVSIIASCRKNNISTDTCQESFIENAFNSTFTNHHKTAVVNSKDIITNFNKHVSLEVCPLPEIENSILDIENNTSNHKNVMKISADKIIEKFDEINSEQNKQKCNILEIENEQENVASGPQKIPVKGNDNSENLIVTSTTTQKVLSEEDSRTVCKITEKDDHVDLTVSDQSESNDISIEKLQNTDIIEIENKKLIEEGQIDKNNKNTEDKIDQEQFIENDNSMNFENVEEVLIVAHSEESDCSIALPTEPCSDEKSDNSVNFENVGSTKDKEIENVTQTEDHSKNVDNCICINSEHSSEEVEVLSRKFSHIEETCGAKTKDNVTDSHGNDIEENIICQENKNSEAFSKKLTNKIASSECNEVENKEREQNYENMENSVEKDKAFVGDHLEEIAEASNIEDSVEKDEVFIEEHLEETDKISNVEDSVEKSEMFFEKHVGETDETSSIGIQIQHNALKEDSCEKGLKENEIFKNTGYSSIENVFSEKCNRKVNEGFEEHDQYPSTITENDNTIQENVNIDNTKNLTPETEISSEENIDKVQVNVVENQNPSEDRHEMDMEEQNIVNESFESVDDITDKVEVFSEEHIEEIREIFNSGIGNPSEKFDIQQDNLKKDVEDKCKDSVSLENGEDVIEVIEVCTEHIERVSKTGKNIIQEDNIIKENENNASFTNAADIIETPENHFEDNIKKSNENLTIGAEIQIIPQKNLNLESMDDTSKKTEEPAKEIEKDCCTESIIKEFTNLPKVDSEKIDKNCIIQKQDFFKNADQVQNNITSESVENAVEKLEVSSEESIEKISKENFEIIEEIKVLSKENTEKTTKSSVNIEDAAEKIKDCNQKIAKSHENVEEVVEEIQVLLKENAKKTYENIVNVTEEIQVCDENIVKSHESVEDVIRKIKVLPKENANITYENVEDATEEIQVCDEKIAKSHESVEEVIEDITVLSKENANIIYENVEDVTEEIQVCDEKIAKSHESVEEVIEDITVLSKENANITYENVEDVTEEIQVCDEKIAKSHESVEDLIEEIKVLSKEKTEETAKSYENGKDVTEEIKVCNEKIVKSHDSVKDLVEEIKVLSEESNEKIRKESCEEVVEEIKILPRENIEKITKSYGNHVEDSTGEIKICNEKIANHHESVKDIIEEIKVLSEESNEKIVKGSTEEIIKEIEVLSVENTEKTVKSHENVEDASGEIKVCNEKVEKSYESVKEVLEEIKVSSEESDEKNTEGSITEIIKEIKVLPIENTEKTVKGDENVEDATGEIKICNEKIAKSHENVKDVTEEIKVLFKESTTKSGKSYVNVEDAIEQSSEKIANNHSKNFENSDTVQEKDYLENCVQEKSNIDINFGNLEGIVEKRLSEKRTDEAMIENYENQGPVQNNSLEICTKENDDGVNFEDSEHYSKATNENFVAEIVLSQNTTTQSNILGNDSKEKADDIIYFDSVEDIIEEIEVLSEENIDDTQNQYHNTEQDNKFKNIEEIIDRIHSEESVKKDDKKDFIKEIGEVNYTTVIENREISKQKEKSCTNENIKNRVETGTHFEDQFHKIDENSKHQNKNFVKNQESVKNSVENKSSDLMGVGGIENVEVKTQDSIQEDICKNLKKRKTSFDRKNVEEKIEKTKTISGKINKNNNVTQIKFPKKDYKKKTSKNSKTVITKVEISSAGTINHKNVKLKDSFLAEKNRSQIIFNNDEDQDVQSDSSGEIITGIIGNLPIINQNRKDSFIDEPINLVTKKVNSTKIVDKLDSNVQINERIKDVERLKIVSDVINDIIFAVEAESLKKYKKIKEVDDTKNIIFPVKIAQEHEKSMDKNEKIVKEPKRIAFVSCDDNLNDNEANESFNQEVLFEENCISSNSKLRNENVIEEVNLETNDSVEVERENTKFRVDKIASFPDTKLSFNTKPALKNSKSNPETYRLKKYRKVTFADMHESNSLKKNENFSKETKESHQTIFSKTQLNGKENTAAKYEITKSRTKSKDSVKTNQKRIEDKTKIKPKIKIKLARVSDAIYSIKDKKLNNNILNVNSEEKLSVNRSAKNKKDYSLSKTKIKNKCNDTKDKEISSLATKIEEIPNTIENSNLGIDEIRNSEEQIFQNTSASDDNENNNLDISEIVENIIYLNKINIGNTGEKNTVSPRKVEDDGLQKLLEAIEHKHKQDFMDKESSKIVTNERKDLCSRPVIHQDVDDSGIDSQDKPEDLTTNSEVQSEVITSCTNEVVTEINKLKEQNSTDRAQNFLDSNSDSTGGKSKNVLTTVKVTNFENKLKIETKSKLVRNETNNKFLIKNLLSLEKENITINADYPRINFRVTDEPKIVEEDKIRKVNYNEHLPIKSDKVEILTTPLINDKQLIEELSDQSSADSFETVASVKNDIVEEMDNQLNKTTNLFDDIDSKIKIDLPETVINNRRIDMKESIEVRNFNSLAINKEIAPSVNNSSTINNSYVGNSLHTKSNMYEMNYGNFDDEIDYYPIECQEEIVQTNASETENIPNINNNSLKEQKVTNSYQSNQNYDTKPGHEIILTNNNVKKLSPSPIIIYSIENAQTTKSETVSTKIDPWSNGPIKKRKLTLDMDFAPVENNTFKTPDDLNFNIQNSFADQTHIINNNLNTTMTLNSNTKNIQNQINYPKENINSKKRALVYEDNFVDESKRRKIKEQNNYNLPSPIKRSQIPIFSSAKMEEARKLKEERRLQKGVQIKEISNNNATVQAKEKCLNNSLEPTEIYENSTISKNNNNYNTFDITFDGKQIFQPNKICQSETESSFFLEDVRKDVKLRTYAGYKRKNSNKSPLKEKVKILEDRLIQRAYCCDPVTIDKELVISESNEINSTVKDKENQGPLIEEIQKDIEPEILADVNNKIQQVNNTEICAMQNPPIATTSSLSSSSPPPQPPPPPSSSSSSLISVTNCKPVNDTPYSDISDDEIEDSEKSVDKENTSIDMQYSIFLSNCAMFDTQISTTDNDFLSVRKYTNESSSSVINDGVCVDMEIFPNSSFIIFSDLNDLATYNLDDELTQLPTITPDVTKIVESQTIPSTAINSRQYDRGNPVLTQAQLENTIEEHAARHGL